MTFQKPTAIKLPRGWKIDWLGKQFRLRDQEWRLLSLLIKHPDRIWQQDDLTYWMSDGLKSDIGINSSNLDKRRNCLRQTLRRLRDTLKSADLYPSQIEITSKAVAGVSVAVRRNAVPV